MIRTWRLIAYILIWLIIQSTSAEEINIAVFKWVDGDGITHYSDELPTGAAHQDDAIEATIFNQYASRNTDDHYSVINQAKRMEVSRLQREQLTIEKKRLARKQQFRRSFWVFNSEPVEYGSKYHPPYDGYYPHSNYHRFRHPHRYDHFSRYRHQRHLKKYYSSKRSQFSHKSSTLRATAIRQKRPRNSMR